MSKDKMTAVQALERFRQDLLPDPHDERDIDASWIRRRWEKYEPIIRQALSAPRVPELTVRLMSFPESTGKRNWTAMFVRKEPWSGLAGNCHGITICRGELWNRVAYEFECARFLLGDRDTQPDILDYGDDIETPEQWAGEIRGGHPIKNKAMPAAAPEPVAASQREGDK